MRGALTESAADAEHWREIGALFLNDRRRHCHFRRFPPLVILLPAHLRSAAASLLRSLQQELCGESKPCSSTAKRSKFMMRPDLDMSSANK